MSETRKPNIIFLMTDQQRWDCIGKYNKHIKTPTLDRLAEEGVVFSQAVCQAPMCVPSRSSMMFGLYPSQLGVRTNHGGLYYEDKLPVQPLAELLRQEGYQTAGFGKTHWNHGLHNPVPPTRGFDVRAVGLSRDSGHYEENALMMSDDDPEGLRAYYEETKDYGSGEENANGYIGCTSQVPMHQHRDGWVAEQCKKFIETGIDPERPLFLYLSFLKPHAGFNVPKEFEDWYRLEDIPDIEQPPWEAESGTHLEEPVPEWLAEAAAAGEADSVGGVGGNVGSADGEKDAASVEDVAGSGPSSGSPGRNGVRGTSGGGQAAGAPKLGGSSYWERRRVWESLSRMERRRTTLRYWANCSWLDHYFGEVLDGLRAKGVLDNALIVFVSDHGELMGERQHRFSKYCLYDSSVRVPLVLAGSWLPEELRGTEDPRPAELIDLVPTLVKAAGGSPSPLLPGLDLLGGAQRAGTFCEFHRKLEDGRFAAPAYMWRKQDWKLILYLPGALHDAVSRVGELRGELYNLAEDPNEWENLYEDPGYLGTRERLTAELLMHLASVWTRGPFFYDNQGLKALGGL